MEAPEVNAERSLDAEVVRALGAIAAALEAAERQRSGKGLAHVRDVFEAERRVLYRLIRKRQL